MIETFDERVLQRWLEITRVYLEQRGLAKPYAEAAIIVRPKSQNASTESLALAP